MTTLRTVVGVCREYVKTLKKRLAGKRDHRRRQKLQRQDVSGTNALDPRGYNYYDNEAVDNIINEFIDNKKTVTDGL